MATKRDDYELNLRATDRASGEVDKLLDRIKDLTDADKTVILNAEAKKLETEVRRATVLLGKVDGEEAEAVLDARNAAQTKLDAVQGELDEIAGRTAEATLEADDNASDDVDRLDGKLDGVDGRTVDATLEADDRATGDIDRVDEALDEIDRRSVDAVLDVVGGGGEALGDMVGDLGVLGGGIRGLASPGGAAAALGALFIGMATSTADTAVEVDNIARFTGASHEAASRLYAVLRDQTNIEANDLLDIVAQMQGVLADNPELARDLGLSLDEVRSDPLQAFIKAVDLLSSDQLTANERILIGSQLFGEEGVRQVNAIIGAVEDEGGLQSAIDAVADNRIFTQEDVADARDFKEQLSEVQGAISGIAADLGGPVLEVLTPALNLLGEIAAVIPDAWDVLTLDGGRLGEANITDELGHFLELVGRGTPQLEAWKLAISGTGEGFDVFQAQIASANRMIADGVPLHEAMFEAFGYEGDAALAVADILGITDAALGDVNDVVVETTDSLEDNVDALEDQRDALKDNVAALDDYRDAVRTAYDADVDYREAIQDKEDALARYTEVLNDNEASEVDRREAGERVISSMLAEADAAVAVGRAAAEAAGETWTAVNATDTLNGSLMMQARTIPRELLPAFAEMILDLNDISGEHRAEIKALIAEGDFAAAQRRLNEVSRTRASAILTTVKQAQIQQIDRSLDWISRDRSSVVNVAANVSNAISAIRRVTTALAVANTLRNVLGRASGDENFQGGPVVVGEQGPELVDLPTGTRITPNHQIDERLAADAPTGNTYNITNNWPAGTPPRQVAAAQRRYERIRGPI